MHATESGLLQQASKWYGCYTFQYHKEISIYLLNLFVTQNTMEVKQQASFILKQPIYRCGQGNLERKF